MEKVCVVKLDHPFPPSPAKRAVPVVKLGGKWAKRRERLAEFSQPRPPEVYEEIARKRFPHDVAQFKIRVAKEMSRLNEKDRQIRDLQRQVDSLFMKRAGAAETPQELNAQLARMAVLSDQKDTELKRLKSRLERALS